MRKVPKECAKPQIRFAGFDDTWERRKLGELGTIMTGSTPPTSHKEYYSNDGIPWVTPTDIESNLISETPKKLSAEGEKIGRVVSANTILVTCIASIGKNALLQVKGSFNQQINSLTPNEKNDSYFLLTESELWSVQMKRRAASATMQIVNKNEFSELETMVPSKNEQKQIGEYFKQIDYLITLQQGKYNKLTNIKKSMLEKMFPKNGSNVPEIRFKGFSNAWEQRKFDDITFLAGEKNKNNLPYESYSVTNDNGFIPQNEQFENGGIMSTADKSMYYIVTQNSFAYNPARINVGSIGYYDKPENVIVSSLYEVFKTTDDIDDRFLWHWFKSDAFQKMIEQYQEGGVRLYFYYDKLCMCFLLIPNIQEQRKIGKQLDTIDKLIALQQCKLEKLKNLKKACLEKMFV